MCMTSRIQGGTKDTVNTCSFAVVYAIQNLLMCRNCLDSLTVVSFLYIAYATSVAFQEDPSQKSYNQDLYNASATI